MYNYTPQPTHHAKFDFDPTTWVVWANSQFATASGVFLLSFLSFFCFLRLAYKSCWRMNRHYSALSKRVLRQGCAFCGLKYLIFTFLSIFLPKIVKIKPEIGNFKPKC